MEEARLAYRTRTAEAADDAPLRAAIGTTLAHPDKQGKRESYRGAASRGDILILEHYDRQERAWRIAGFAECHLRVDDSLSIRDIGTAGDEPQVGVVRYLLEQAFSSFRPVSCQVKVRRDAEAWLDILGAIPGFAMDGEEYRRPHYWTIWQWDPQRARAAERPNRAARSQQPPRPPQRPAARPTGNGQRPAPPPRAGGGPPGNRFGPGPSGPSRPRPGDPSGRFGSPRPR